MTGKGVEMGNRADAGGGKLRETRGTDKREKERKWR